MARTLLGISAFYHDAAAALLRDGEIVAAAQEERFTRCKHDPRFPEQAINYCLEEAFVTPDSLDAIVFYDNPLLTLDRTLKSCLAGGGESQAQFERASRTLLGRKFRIREQVLRSLGSLGRLGRILYAEHHLSHAASAFYPSPFRNAAILVLDGVGEWATTSVGRGEDARIELLEEIRYPHSVGLLYSAFTTFCGFKANSGEYKLMGLAPYGEPRYYDAIRRHLVDLRDDGSFRLNMDYFGFLGSARMTNARFEELFGGPPRERESRITRREMDLAASVQRVTEEIVLALARHARHETGAKHLVMAGGVALNCVANGRVLREAGFEDLWVQPAAGDAGGALGAAFLAHHAFFGEPRAEREGRDAQKGSCLGPAYSSSEVRAFLDRQGAPYARIEDPGQRAREVARSLAEGRVVGWFSGRMEFGPRALGARSILGDPRRGDMQSRVNLRIKLRESFRPFAPSVLAERAREYFELDAESPYMLLVAPVRKERRTAPPSVPLDEEDLIQQVHRLRSDIPAVTHVDYSARAQTVRLEVHAEFHRLLEAFRTLTGCGILLNTSFNVRGEPLVCTPSDAYRCFMRTGMDLLVLEDCLLRKEEQPVLVGPAQADKPVRQDDPGGSHPEVLFFFRQALLPLAEKLRAEGKSCFPLRPDSRASSYFTPCRRRGVRPGDLEDPGCAPEPMAQALVLRWEAEGFPELAALAPGLVRLASCLDATGEPLEELPPYLYAMF